MILIVFKIKIFSLFAINSYAQQTNEIDSKSVKLPRHANQVAVKVAQQIISLLMY